MSLELRFPEKNVVILPPVREDEEYFSVYPSQIDRKDPDYLSRIRNEGERINQAGFADTFLHCAIQEAKYWWRSPNTIYNTLWPHEDHDWAALDHIARDATDEEHRVNDEYKRISVNFADSIILVACPIEALRSAAIERCKANKSPEIRVAYWRTALWPQSRSTSAERAILEALLREDLPRVPERETTRRRKRKRVSV